MSKWIGSKPEKCELCEKPFEKFFYDARTKWGQWGLLCLRCVERDGVGLGLGKGQKYDLATLEKVEG